MDTKHHPLLLPQKVVFQTRPMETLEQDVLRWLWTGATGGLVLGRARIGKTTAIEVLKQKLRFRDGSPVPNHLVSVPRRDRETVANLLRVLCISANIRVSSKMRSDVMESDFCHFMMDQALQTTHRRFVLMVDEMQRLTIPQLDVLATLYDVLRIHDIHLFVVLVGNQTEMGKLLNNIDFPQYEHLRGRFFGHIHRYTGLVSEKDIKACLKQYDANYFPADSSKSYTNYFLPKHLKRFKYATLSKVIWRSFKTIKRDHKVEELGMQYFRTVADSLLMDYLPHCPPDEIEQETIESIFLNSGLIGGQITHA